MNYKIYPTPEQRAGTSARGLGSSQEQWLKLQAERDNKLWNNSDPNTKKFWIVNSKLYDLTKFVDKHPGGSSWLKLTQGLDISDHFILHHLNLQKATQTLQKYYVCDCVNKRSVFTYDQNGLYWTVRKRVLQKYSKQYLQEGLDSKVNAVIIFLLWIATLLLTVWTRSYICAGLCSMLLVANFGISHHFGHLKQNIFPNVLYTTGTTPRQRQINHAIGHHGYVSMEPDQEVGSFQPILHHLKNQPANPIYIEPLMQVVFFLYFPILMICKIFIFPITRWHRPKFENGFPLLVLILLCVTSTDSFWQSFKLFFFMYGLYGVLYYKTLHCGHRLQQLWSQGSEKIEDIGQHIVYSSNDTDPNLTGFWSFLLSGGLNLHNAHHFFPTADHGKLYELTQIIKQVCRQRGIRYTENNRLGCWMSISRGLVNRIKWERTLKP